VTVLAYLRFEVARTLRNRRYLFLVIGFPVAFYLLFTHTFGKDASAADQARFVRDYMVAMSAYGALGAALMATGPRLAAERAVGWHRQLRLTPLSAGGALVAKVLSAMVSAAVAPVVVTVVGRLVNHVSLPAGRWLLVLALLWLGTLPFAALGVAIGYLVDGETAQVVTIISYVALAVLGGFWFPVDQLGSGLRHLAEALPSYRYADLGWQAVAGHLPPALDVAMLAGWTLAFLALGALAYRRPQVRAA
jgi:ABC-2 type transport system permease protein